MHSFSKNSTHYSYFPGEDIAVMFLYRFNAATCKKINITVWVIVGWYQLILKKTWKQDNLSRHTLTFLLSCIIQTQTFGLVYIFNILLDNLGHILGQSWNNSLMIDALLEILRLYSVAIIWILVTFSHLSTQRTHISVPLALAPSGNHPALFQHHHSLDQDQMLSDNTYWLC